MLCIHYLGWQIVLLVLVCTRDLVAVSQLFFNCNRTLQTTRGCYATGRILAYISCAGHANPSFSSMISMAWYVGGIQRRHNQPFTLLFAPQGSLELICDWVQLAGPPVFSDSLSGSSIRWRWLQGFRSGCTPAQSSWSATPAPCCHQSLVGNQDSYLRCRQWKTDCQNVVDFPRCGVSLMFAGFPQSR